MKKYKPSLFLLIVLCFFALLAAFLLYVFINRERTFSCTYETTDCLTQAAQLPFLQKIGQGFICLFTNFACLLKEFF